MATATNGTGVAMQLFNAGTSGKRLNLNPIEGEIEPTGPQLTLVRLGSSVKIKQAGSDLYLTAGESGGLAWAAPSNGKTQQWTFTDTTGAPAPAGGTEVAGNGSSTANNGELIEGQRPSSLDYTSDNYKQKFVGPNGEYIGQCTWHCYGRALETTGKAIAFKEAGGNDAQNWVNNVTNCDKLDYPVSNSIAVFYGGTYGHVIYVEKVDGDTVYYTEANARGENKLYSGYNSQDGIVKITTITEFEKKCGGNPTYLVPN